MFPKSVASAAHGVILVVDVTNRESFTKVKDWNDRIKEEFKSNVNKILVGNKLDLNNQRAVDPLEGHKLAKLYGFKAYYEMSALHNINVNKPIEDMLQEVYFMLNMSSDEMAFGGQGESEVHTTMKTYNATKQSTVTSEKVQYDQDSNFSFAGPGGKTDEMIARGLRPATAD